jgi:hypothetical protein
MEEVLELRRNANTTNLELIRREREATRLRASLRRAEAIVEDAGRTHPRHEVGHPPEERATITQHNINNLFARSRSASRSPSNMRRRVHFEDE